MFFPVSILKYWVFTLRVFRSGVIFSMRLDGRKEIQSVKSTWSIWIRSVKDAIKDAIIKDAKQTYIYTHHAKSKPYRSKETAR